MATTVWRQLRRRASDWLGRWSIRAKVLTVVAALVLASGVIVLLLARTLLVQNMQAELRQHGTSIAQAVATVCAGETPCPDRDGLTTLLQQLVRRNPDLRYVFATDGAGHVLEFIINPALEHDPADYYRIADLSRNGASLVGPDRDQVWESRAAIASDQGGLIRVGMGEAQMWDTIDLVAGKLALSVAFVTAFGIIVAVVATWVLTRPLVELAAATTRIGQGDYSLRLRYRAQDEIGALGQALDLAARQLAQAEAERQEREQLRQYYLQRVIQAQEEERRRVARELHDQTGQALTSLLVGLRNAEEAPDEVELRSRLANLRHMVATTLDQVRELAFDLRPALLDDLGLVAALGRYASQMDERFGMRVEVQAIGLDGIRLRPDLETTVYRIVQEALLNAARHAHCTCVSIVVQSRDDFLTAIIEDNGCGFDCEQVFGDDEGANCLGLHGMRERAELVGGTLEVETTPGEGCAVYLRAPLTTAPSREPIKEAVY